MRQSIFIRKAVFLTVIASSVLSMTSCNWDWDDEIITEEENMHTAAGHWTYLYTKDVLMNYTDIFFFVRNLQIKLQQNPLLSNEPLFFIPEATVYVNTDDEENLISYEISTDVNNDRPQYEISAVIKDDIMREWHVTATSREDNVMEEYTMDISMNGNRWSITECSSQPNLKYAWSGNTGILYTFYCNSTMMSIRWMDIDPERITFEFKAKGTMESLSQPALVIDYSTTRPIIVSQFMNYNQDRRKKERKNTMFYFTQWIIGTLDLDVYDPIDNVHEDVTAKILDGNSSRITFRGIESDYYW